MLGRQRRTEIEEFVEDLVDYLESTSDQKRLSPSCAKERKSPMKTAPFSTATNPAEVQRRFGRCVVTRFTDIAKIALACGDVDTAREAIRTMRADDEIAADFVSVESYEAYRLAQLRGRVRVRFGSYTV